MTISRRGLFGTLFGAVAAGYAAKAAPAFASGGPSKFGFIKVPVSMIGEAGPESIMPFSQFARLLTANEIRVLEGMPPITINTVAGGCTRDGDEEQVS